MDTHSLEKLEYGRIRTLLAGFARCSLGRGLAERLAPGSRYGDVVRRLESTRQMHEAVEAHGLPPLAGVHDIHALIEKCVPPTGLDPEEFALVAETLGATHAVRAWLDAVCEPADAYPLLRGLGDGIGDFNVVAETIRRAIDARGHVRDDASEKLRSIRRTIEQAKARVGVVVQRLLRSSHVVRMLQYAGSTFHDDRVVLPLRAEHRGRLPGIIHRSSDSGATFFVEPAEAVELNNTVTRLRADESAEITRILWRLAQNVHQNQAEILRTLGALAELDLLTAKVLFGRAFEMRLPGINRDGVVRLIDARHPLLLAMARETREAGGEPSEVVPIDVRLGDDFDMLVITGPNTGGKTVALKTVGLLAAMLQSGLPIPAAEGSSMPVFDDVLIDVGDEQSLQQSLSTFSAHMRRLLEILGTARRRTLVLIDELGAGTDPDEGAALGRALMDELLRIGCRSMITTHLGVLKAVAFSHPRVDNASVDFDIETLTPRYTLRIGEAGNSNALAIATRLGLPRKIVEAARGHLSKQHRALGKAIQQTAHTRRRAERARRDAEDEQRKAAAAHEAAQREAETLRARQAAFDDWTQRIAALKPGDKVHVARFDQTGTVVRMELHRQRALVSVGAMDVDVPLTELNPGEGKARRR